MWQSDITSFVLPRQGRRVYLTVFLDDYSRYIVSWGLYLNQKQEIVIETLLQGIERFGKPKEVLTDQGRQYFAWRGKSDLQKLLQKEGIQHVVARTHHPQTVGKTERFWATVGEEFWERLQPQEFLEAKERFGHFVAHYNHFRPHQGIDGMVPADRFFGVEKQVRETLEKAMSRNELHLALGEAPRKPVFLVGQIGDQQVSMHGERGRLVVQTEDGHRQELGMEDEHGRNSGEDKQKGQRKSEAEVQVSPKAGLAGESDMGSGDSRGEGKGSRNSGGNPGVLDGAVEPGSGGGEAGNAEVARVAVVEAGPFGSGGGAGETAKEAGQEETSGGPSAGGRSESPEQANSGVGT